MAKSSAKKVAAAAPVAVVQDKKSAKKGKRGGEEAKEKIVNVKKQKLQNDEAVASKKKVEAKIVKKKKKDETSSSDEAESESDEEPPKKPVVANAPKSAPQKKVDESESESGSDESGSDESDDEPQNEKSTTKKIEGSEDSSDGESEEESEEEEPVKTSKKKGADVEMVDAATPKPKTPATSEGEGTKTLFVGNLSYNVEQADVEDFFKDVGEVVGVRFASAPDGSFKGFGHVEFASVEAARKALELNGAELSGRQVKLDLARERGAATPKSSNFPKAEGNSVFIRGFDKNLGEEEARSALQEHFGACGEITRCSIPTDRDTGGIKGIAYIDFSDNKSVDQALELSGSDLGGCSLYVDMAKPMGDGGSRSGGFSSGGGRGRGGRGGRGGDRGRGGRRGGGRRGGRGRF